MKINYTIPFNRIRSILLLSALCAVSVQGRAQETAQAAPTASGDDQFALMFLWVFIGIEFFLLLFFLVTVNNLLKAVIESQLKATALKGAEAISEKAIRAAGPKTAWQTMMEKLTDSKPIEQEKDILLDHDYDGIRELDNHLPPWWKWGFYFTIFWGVIYLVNYHIFPVWNEGYSQEAEFFAEMATAEKQIAEYRKTAADLVDENNVTLLTDVASLDKGKAKFKEVCAACHGDNGQGGIGPNLTDAYWIHGGDVKSVFKVVKYGVLEKGMISWKDEMKPNEMQAVISYIFTLQGSDPAGAKEPQGDLYTAEVSSVSAETSPVDSTIEAK
jgi:cytochrome c oxidase cbb3-type subunit 3